MVRRGPACAAALGLAAAIVGGMAGAQTPPPEFDTGESVFSLGVGTLLVTLDQERLFEASAFGRRVDTALTEASRQLTTENREIEAMLTAEEAALTEQRATLAPEAFRALADDFDARVERLRRQQEDRARALSIWRDIEQQRFFEAAVPVLMQLLRDTGAVAIIDSRAILLALEESDLTDPAIARMDAALGDGAAGAVGVFSPQTLPPELGAESPPRPPATGGNGTPPVTLPTPGAP